jgi:hypothetical protein
MVDVEKKRIAGTPPAKRQRELHPKSTEMLSVWIELWMNRTQLSIEQPELWIGQTELWMDQTELRMDQRQLWME